MFLCVVVPSPTCASENKSRQPDTCLPHPANHQPHEKHTSKSVTCPKSFLPQHDTPPLLDTAQECSCKPRVTQQWPLPSTSRNQPPSNATPMITTSCAIDKQRMKSALSSLAASRTPMLTRFTVAHLALYAAGRCRNAQCDQGACWDFPSSGSVDA